VELLERLLEEVVERRKDWKYQVRRERLEQQLMVHHQEVEVEVEESVVQGPLAEGEEPGQKEQMEEGEALDWMMREEVVEDQKAFEMLVVAGLAEP